MWATSSSHAALFSRSGKGLGMTLAFTSSGRLRSPPVCPTLKTRSGRARPIMERSQRIIVAARCPKPLRKARWTNIQTTQPGKPLSRSPRTLTMALNRPTAAALPRSRYLKATASLPSRRRLMVLAAWRPPCMATSQTPGRSWSVAMSPTANTSGWPGRVRSSATAIRPARSVSAPVASASRPASGDAWTPAAQMTVAHSIRAFSPSEASVSTPSRVDPHDPALHAQFDPHLLQAGCGLAPRGGRRSSPAAPCRRRPG